METIGSNAQDLKANNRMLVLKIIATHFGLSRTQLASITGLSKMSISNIVSELIASRYIAEFENQKEATSSGRKPLSLKLSDHSPCICGMLIERDFLQIALGDLSGTLILPPVNVPLDSNALCSDEVIQYLYQAFMTLKDSTRRDIIAIGISSIGPLDSKNGLILRPPFFHNIEIMPIVSEITKLTEIPTYLMNESNAGALAEKLYGDASGVSNFLYLHITNGIGAGVVLDNKLYDGEFGQNGGLGHTSINFAGPRCECGNAGCLELYANIKQLRYRIQELKYLYPGSPLASLSAPSWIQILDAANTRDTLAVLALDQFCTYIAQAITNTLNILDLSTIIIDYPFHVPGSAMEDLLTQKLALLRPQPFYHSIKVQKSTFIGKASLIGSISIVADKIFHFELPLCFSCTKTDVNP